MGFFLLLSFVLSFLQLLLTSTLLVGLSLLLTFQGNTAVCFFAVAFFLQSSLLARQLLFANALHFCLLLHYRLLGLPVGLRGQMASIDEEADCKQEDGCQTARDSNQNARLPPSFGRRQEAREPLER